MLGIKPDEGILTDTAEEEDNFEAEGRSHSRTAEEVVVDSLGCCCDSLVLDSKTWLKM